jgi:phenylacetate-CoA ligase
MPLLRYRTGDLCTLIREKCACGRTLVRMSEIKGRVDDMLILRGVNVYPSEIERVLFGIPELAPYYQIIIERVSTLDEATVHVEATPQFQENVGKASIDEDAWKAHDEVDSLRQKVGRSLQDALGLHIGVNVFTSGTLPRSEGKAVRIVDRRK